MKRQRVFIVGVGMTKFLKPSENNPDYTILSKIAVTRALIDSKIKFSAIDAAAVGYVFGNSTSGQRSLYDFGMNGIPIYNVNNNCATGSSAIHLLANLIRGGIYQSALALGFQKMQKGGITFPFQDRIDPLDRHITKSAQFNNLNINSPYIPRLFGNAGQEHMKLFGTKPEHFGKIAAKNHRHSLNNPYSQFQRGWGLEQIMKSNPIYGVLTKLQCCPTSDGAAAAILCNQSKVKQWNLQDQAVQILDMQLTTDIKKAYTNSRQLVGYSMSKLAAEKVYKNTGLKASDIGVVQLHDCFSTNQLITYQALGLCKQGQAAQFIDQQNNTYGGKVVVNPSGGLTSKGHPLGATGLAQCCQLNWQLRGIAGKRQVANLKYGLQHNLGLGGACVVAIYKKYNNNISKGTSNPIQIEEQQKNFVFANQ